MRFRTIRFVALLGSLTACAFPSAARAAGVGPEGAARRGAPGGAGPAAAPGPAARDQAIRELFLAVERIARMPAAEQAKEMPHLYRDLAPAVMNEIMVEGILSTCPSSVLERDGKFGAGGHGGFEAYTKQLDNAAATMTPEEVAGRIQSAHGFLIVRVAVRRRALQVMTGQREAMKALIAEDLKSDDPKTISRAMQAIPPLKLDEFLDQVVAMYLAGGPSAEAAKGALTWLNDPRAAAPLIADIEKNPAHLKLHYLLLNGMLDGKPADPVLVRLLDSKDDDVRSMASTAIGLCRDASLAPRVIKLLADPDPRVRATAVGMAFHLPDEAFAKVRTDLIAIARDGDAEVRMELAVALAARKDAAAGPLLLAFWKGAREPKESWRIMQGVGALTNSTFGYNPREWGPGVKENREAIAAFEKWIAAQAY